MLLTGSQLENRTLITATPLELAYLVFTERLCYNTSALRAWACIAWIFHGTNDKNASPSAPRVFNLLDREQPDFRGLWVRNCGARHSRTLTVLCCSVHLRAHHKYHRYGDYQPS